MIFLSQAPRLLPSYPSLTPVGESDPRRLFPNELSVIISMAGSCEGSSGSSSGMHRGMKRKVKVRVERAKSKSRETGTGGTKREREKLTESKFGQKDETDVNDHLSSQERCLKR